MAATTHREDDDPDRDDMTIEEAFELLEDRRPDLLDDLEQRLKPYLSADESLGGDKR